MEGKRNNALCHQKTNDGLRLYKRENSFSWLLSTSVNIEEKGNDNSYSTFEFPYCSKSKPYNTFFRSKVENILFCLTKLISFLNLQCSISSFITRTDVTTMWHS